METPGLSSKLEDKLSLNCGSTTDKDFFQHYGIKTDQWHLLELLKASPELPLHSEKTQD